MKHEQKWTNTISSRMIGRFETGRDIAHEYKLEYHWAWVATLQYLHQEQKVESHVELQNKRPWLARQLNSTAVSSSWIRFKFIWKISKNQWIFAIFRQCLYVRTHFWVYNLFIFWSAWTNFSHSACEMHSSTANSWLKSKTKYTSNVYMNGKQWW